MSLSIITLTEKPNMLYYLADELKKLSPDYFVGTSKTIRKIIERKNIPNTEYTYATTFKKQWRICDTSCKKGKLLLNKNWCELNIQLNQKITNDKKEIDIEDNIENNNINEEINVISQEQILEAPSILILEDHEKFRDSDGKIIEIQTRGEKIQDKIYFKVKDVSIGFDLPYLKDSLLKTDRGYERNVDYVTFIITDINKNVKKSIYLTYKGFVKYITKSRKYIPDTLTNWLTELLGVPFVHHYFITPETDTINSIVKILDCKYIKQYKIDKYRVDLYVPEYNLVIECDENGHKDRDIEYEKDRENYIHDKLKCVFIRYDPYSKNFDIFNIIKQINIIIKIQEKMEKMKNEHENELLKKEMEKLKLQYEKDNYRNMYEYGLKEQENKDTIYKLQIENLKLQLELTKK